MRQCVYERGGPGGSEVIRLRSGPQPIRSRPRIAPAQDKNKSLMVAAAIGTRPADKDRVKLLVEA